MDPDIPRVNIKQFQQTNKNSYTSILKKSVKNKIKDFVCHVTVHKS